MMTKENRKKRARALIEKYQKILHLTEWEFKFDIVNPDQMSNKDHAMEIHINLKYLRAFILATEEAFKSPNDLEKHIKHELSHCLTEPLWDMAHDLWNGKFHTKQEIEMAAETLTERIAMLVKP